ncbi:MAG TPA: 16S rRNA (guanine(527)-N(7))-methyltransferase RsmG [Polyangia bacterium]|nr:16S rRNA (guanine(527)-N(7))-methyltransferase RsmG [Polyangia bacterium]
MSGTEAAAEELRTLSASWGAPCDAGTAASLLRYAALLVSWNERINLTGARSPAAVVTDHYPDAFALARRLDGPRRVVDVGSGGGLPAIPLAVLRPALTLTLVEPIAKKVAFLRTAIRELDLSARVSLEAGRAGALIPGDFDAAVSRATFAPEDWVVLGRQLVRPGGRVYVLTVPGSAAASLGETETYLDRRRVLVEVPV